MCLGFSILGQLGLISQINLPLCQTAWNKLPQPDFGILISIRGKAFVDNDRAKKLIMLQNTLEESDSEYFAVFQNSSLYMKFWEYVSTSTIT